MLSNALLKNIAPTSIAMMIDMLGIINFNMTVTIPIKIPYNIPVSPIVGLF